MTGSGTQADPYIITTWEELIDTTNRTTTDFCEWQGGDVDLNNIKPEGYTDSVVINGIIDFKNATIKNLHTITGNTPIVFAFGTNGYIKNLNLLNCFFTGNYSYAIQFGKDMSSNMYLENLRIGIFLDYTGDANSDCRIIGTSPDSMYYRSVFQKCSFNFRSDTQSIVRLAYGQKQGFYDCQFDFDIKSKDGYNVTYMTNSDCDVYHSRIKGRYIGQTEETKNFTGINNHSNIYLFNEGSYTARSQGITIYNSDTCTVAGTNVKGCTSAQMADTAYLKSIGFAIGD
jgi:hypothetical protein